MKSEFNKYCADTLGYKDSDLDLLYDRDYNPYDDLNHMSDVVEKLLDEHAPKRSISGAIRRKGIKQTFRDFIVDTMTEGEK